MKISIREATVSDAPIVCNLIHKLAEFENFEDICSLDVKMLTQLMTEENGLSALLAERDNEVVGVLVYYYFKIATFSGRRVLYIEDVFIEESNRKNGIGKELFDKAIKIAKDNNCAKIEWKCLDWNINAQKFYNNIGATLSSEWLTYTIDLK